MTRRISLLQNNMRCVARYSLPSLRRPAVQRRTGSCPQASYSRRRPSRGTRTQILGSRGVTVVLTKTEPTSQRPMRRVSIMIKPREPGLQRSVNLSRLNCIRILISSQRQIIKVSLPPALTTKNARPDNDGVTREGTTGSGRATALKSSTTTKVRFIMNRIQKFTTYFQLPSSTTTSRTSETSPAARDPSSTKSAVKVSIHPLWM